jgi:rod shape-determining protein MreB
MLGRTSESINIIFPLKNGIISNFNLVKDMIRIFLGKAANSKILMPKVLVSIPCETTSFERSLVANAMELAGAREIHLIEAPVAAVLNFEKEKRKISGRLVVNIGSGITNIAVVSLDELVSSKTIKLAGNNIDEEIIKFLKEKYNLLIGKLTAENIKISVNRANEILYYNIKGKNLISGMPSQVSISCEEILKVINKITEKIVREISSVLERTPSELIADISDNGILLCGGSSQCLGLEKLTQEITGIPARLAEEPEYCVIKGMGKFIN